MRLTQIFDSAGNFIYKDYDPYRLDDKYKKYHSFIFTEDGDCAIAPSKLIDFIDLYDFSWKSDVIRLYYAQQHGRETHSQYPAIYMWR